MQAILSTLRIKIKADEENEVYKLYIAKTLKMCSKSVAYAAMGATGGKANGVNYMSINLEDIYKPKKVETRTSKQVITDIKQGLSKLRKE